MIAAGDRDTSAEQQLGTGTELQDSNWGQGHNSRIAVGERNTIAGYQ